MIFADKELRGCHHTVLSCIETLGGEAVMETGEVRVQYWFGSTSPKKLVLLVSIMKWTEASPYAVMFLRGLLI